MIMHDFRCSNGHVAEHAVNSSTTTLQCQCGETSVRVFLTAPKLDYGHMAQGESAPTTAIDKFERMHKDQRAKEERHLREHGDYGPAPGA